MYRCITEVREQTRILQFWGKRNRKGKMATEDNRSLAEKYKELYNKKDKFQITQKEINQILPTWLVLTMIGACYYGQRYITPAVHSSFEVPLIIEMGLYGMMYGIFGEMIVNLWFIRSVKSTFAKEEEEIERAPTPEPVEEMDRAAEVPYKAPVNPEENTDENENKESMVWMRYRGNGQIYAVTMKENESKDSMDPARTVMYPYWSWKPCLICQHSRPPRTHHCPICNECMLRRDYHCFFTGRCIGMNNQRHFIVFSFWSVIGTTCSLIYSGLYVYVAIYDLGILEWYDIFLPQTFIDWLFGNTEFYNVVIFFLIYSVFFFWLACIRFSREQFRSIRAGMTSFEMENKIKIQNTNSFLEELVSIFGPYWYANFLFPMHLQFPLEGNGKDWPNIKQ
ncbi:unnamed protein product [Owenia fusiformis]|uniref:Palmitoyltransferase n=1 Tax=Owenia fusiformis TaxID=6347 RepID=A0A8J1Y1X0_OWEFU|nr:unnamed protein product [Owenia fusiformis]